MKLKKTCRTCSNLYPTTYNDGDYDEEETYYEEKYPCNCDYINDSYNVDSLNNCEHYKQIDLKIILGEE